MGNRLSKTDSAAGTTNSTYDAANRLTATTGAGASAYSNDADGNTLTGGGRTNAWDSQNRLVSCIVGGNTTAYKYGADGLRRQSTKNGVSTDYAYDGTMLVREGHASGGSLTPATVTVTYFQGARGPEYRRDDTQTQVDGQGHTFNGKASWYVFDGLGSVVGEVDPLGNLTSSPKYDVYGAVRGNGGTATSKQGFVGGLGHVSDDTGLIYMRARYYDPNLGRFISEDPAYSGTNWFAYCVNNPVNEVDANGKIGEALVDAIMSALIDADQGFSGTSKLAGMSNDAAIDFIEERIQQLKAGIKTNIEMAGENMGVYLREKVAGDEAGAALFLGLANQQSRGAAEKVVAMAMLNQVADLLVAEQM